MGDKSDKISISNIGPQGCTKIDQNFQKIAQFQIMARKLR